MTFVQMLVIAGSFIVAGIAKGAIGMGMPPIVIGLMTFAFPLDQSLAIMVLPSMVTNVLQAVYGGGFLRLLRRFWIMALAAMRSMMADACPGGRESTKTARLVALSSEVAP